MLDMLLSEIFVWCFCIIGCGITCYIHGKQVGVIKTIEHLVDAGLLELDEE